MKRMLSLLMLLALLLSGCGQGGTKPPAEEPTQKTEEPELTEAEQQAQSDALAAKAGAAYAAITKADFTILVTEPDGAITTLEVSPGVNDWNVQDRENSFPYTYRWSEATDEDWRDQWAAETAGRMVTLALPEKMSLAACTGGDVVEVVEEGTVTYLRAVNPKAGTEPFEWTFGGMLLNVIAADALSYEMWNVTTDGSLHPQTAAEQMLEQIAANYRAAPDWAPWKPEDTLANEADVFDIYWGEPQEFCCGMRLRLKFDDPFGERANRWQAGAGLSEPDAEGYCGYGAEVHIRKNEAEDWQYVERGSGGYTVNPQNSDHKPMPEWLVETFCLTEGVTHDWHIPYRILDLPKEDLNRLPELLRNIPEEQARDLCAVLGENLRQFDYWDWTVDAFRPLLEEFGPWLDA